MNKARIKLLVPHLCGKGPVWMEYVEKLAAQDDIALWAAQKTEHRIIPPLPYQKPHKTFISILHGCLP